MAKNELRRIARLLPHLVVNPNHEFITKVSPTAPLPNLLWMQQVVKTPAWRQGDRLVPLDEVQQWARDNCRGDNRIWPTRARFGEVRDAVLFKLFWG